MVQDSFIEQSFSSHKINGKRKSKPHFWSEAVRKDIYIAILKSYGYFIESHVHRFGDMLKEKLLGIELRNVGINSRCSEKWVGKWLTWLLPNFTRNCIAITTNDGKNFE